MSKFIDPLKQHLFMLFLSCKYINNLAALFTPYCFSASTLTYEVQRIFFTQFLLIIKTSMFLIFNLLTQLVVFVWVPCWISKLRVMQDVPHRDHLVIVMEWGVRVPNQFRECTYAILMSLRFLAKSIMEVESNVVFYSALRAFLTD